jgi:phosphoribosyl-ATP pyrophosphohydrolase/phosphoribosyl-AMP cyclohydrolase/histidinol dehydrogenase
VAVDLSNELLEAIEREVSEQGLVLPRVDVVRISIPKSFILRVSNLKEALDFSNEYAPEHLILHLEEAAKCLDQVQNAGSIFVGHWSPER